MSEDAPRLWLVRAAEACGWLMDVDARYVRILLGSHTKPTDLASTLSPLSSSVTRAWDAEESEQSWKSLLEFLQTEEMAEVTPGRQHAGRRQVARAYPVEEHPEFWSSLIALDQTPETADVVKHLIDRAVGDPRAASASEAGIRIIKSPATEKDGKAFPALRLAYTVVTRPGQTEAEPDEGMVVLLQVRPYAEAAASEDWSRSVQTNRQ